MLLRSVLSGAWFNPFGHMLLNTGGERGFYFQVAGRRACPRYMNCGGYQRYLLETGKKELNRFRVFIPNPEAAQLKIEELLAKPFGWWVVEHNCETFVEEIVTAGGGQPIHRGLFYLPIHSRQQGVFQWDSSRPPMSSGIA